MNQFSSVTQSCLTLCDPMGCSTQSMNSLNSCGENYKKKGENVSEFCTLRCFVISKVKEVSLSYRLPENVSPTM